MIQGAGVLNNTANSTTSQTSIDTSTVNSISTVSTPSATTQWIVSAGVTTSAATTKQPESTDIATETAHGHDVAIGAGVGLPLGLALLAALFLLVWEKRKNKGLQAEQHHKIIQDSRRAAEIVPSTSKRFDDVHEAGGGEPEVRELLDGSKSF